MQRKTIEKMMNEMNENDKVEEIQLDDVEIGEKSLEENSQERNNGWRKKSFIIGISLLIGAVIMGTVIFNIEPHRFDTGKPGVFVRRLLRERATPSPADNPSIAKVQHRSRSLGENEQMYVSPPDDPIPVSIRLINPSIINGYAPGDEGCRDLTADIYNAAAILANNVIKQNARFFDRDHHHYRYSYGGDGMVRRSPGPAMQRHPSAPSVGDAAKAYSPTPTEGDQGYSPAGKGEDSYKTNNQEAGVDEADLMKSDGEFVFTGYGEFVVVWNATTGEEISRTKIPVVPESTRKAHISGLLLDPDSKRIVVAASGYGLRYRYGDLDQPVLSNKGDTRILLYDTSALLTDGSELPLVSTEAMDGEYCSARKIKGTAHIVRQSSVNYYPHIHNRLSRYRGGGYEYGNKEEYLARATSNAKLILHTFAHRLTDELKAISGGSDCSTVTRVAMFADGSGDNREGFPDSFLSGGILNSYSQVSSFRIDAPQREKSALTLNAKTVGSFFPSTNSELYASEDVLVLAGRGYHCDGFPRSCGQSTYFFSYKLHENGSAPTGLAIGKAPGYLLNQFAMDEYQGYFRVATTERDRWGCTPVDPSTVPRRSSHWHWPRWHWPRCNWRRISQSKSRLSLMKFPDSYGEMETVKVIDNLGVTEEIKSARFFDDKAFLVTFMRTDPLYTIDFSNPTDPVVTDELKISGFSSYLHPVGSDKLLAIGKEADETTGRVTGFQITLFDVADLKNATVLQRYTINQRWASSSAESDHLAFRYLSQSKLLIIPISMKKEEPFDGFEVYYVSDEKIEKRFSISMTSSSAMNHGCWYHTYLPARSMVFSGNLTVAKGHMYASYNLETEKKRWSHNLDQSVPKDKCFGYWG